MEFIDKILNAFSLDLIGGNYITDFGNSTL